MAAENMSKKRSMRYDIFTHPSYIPVENYLTMLDEVLR